MSGGPDMVVLHDLQAAIVQLRPINRSERKTFGWPCWQAVRRQARRERKRMRQLGLLVS